MAVSTRHEFLDLLQRSNLVTEELLRGAGEFTVRLHAGFFEHANRRSLLGNGQADDSIEAESGESEV